MPIKPAHAFQAFKWEGEGVIKAQDNALVVRWLFQSSPRDIRKREGKDGLIDATKSRSRGAFGKF